MTEKYITVQEAVKKYGLNLSKIQLAIVRANLNGLYKVIHRKRYKVFLRQDYFEKWLETNDVSSPSLCRGRGASRTNR